MIERSCFFLSFKINYRKKTLIHTHTNTNDVYNEITVNDNDDV